MRSRNKAIYRKNIKRGKNSHKKKRYADQDESITSLEAAAKAVAVFKSGGRYFYKEEYENYFAIKQW